MQRILKEDFVPLPLGITLKNFIAASLGWDCLISSAAWQWLLAFCGSSFKKGGVSC